MFAGTIRGEHPLRPAGRDDEEIVAAAVRAEIHSEIMEMPDGYDTYIGERGSDALRRAESSAYPSPAFSSKNPKILILDEATSALDTVTEQRIQNAFDKLSEGRTTIIIAHRLSTVRNADRIAVIEDEHIIEMGSHDELMAKNGAYAELCRAQSLDKHSGGTTMLNIKKGGHRDLERYFTLIEMDFDSEELLPKIAIHKGMMNGSRAADRLR